MKIYDKEMYKKQESIRMTIIVIVVFLIGFIAGYLATSFGIVGSIGNNTNEQKANGIALIEEEK